MNRKSTALWNGLFVCLMCCSLAACSLSGFKYSIVEDDHYCLLKGEFYNYNPILKYKAYFPHAFLFKKTDKGFSRSNEIKSTFEFDKIVDGYVSEECCGKVEIRLVLQHPQQSVNCYLASENGSYSIKDRKKVADLMAYLEKNEVDIFKSLH